MSQHGIENIKIENFKCFENLEINGFKRLNLIGGKNNVGKTALLEALELLVKSVNSNALALNALNLIRRRRGRDRVLDFDLSYKDQSSLIITTYNKMVMISKPNQMDLFELSDSETGFIFRVNEDVVVVPFDRFVHRSLPLVMRDASFIDSIPVSFIKSSKLDEEEVAALYGSIIEVGKEGFLDDSLSAFDSSIVAFKIVPTERATQAKVKTKMRDKLVSLNSLGEGVNRYIAILCAIWASQDGYLFIDEIENGIHYTNYPKLWQLIFQASAQANCQVFVTSHSKECITAFNNTQLLETNKDSGSYFELFYSQKKQRISAAYRDAEQLEYALNHNEDIRGE
ncbi:MAG: hypothetical protein RLZZ422_2868 [Pseudomonadota bacterium]|jgi:AAA15 family ATPase/GTPase